MNASLLLLLMMARPATQQVAGPEALKCVQQTKDVTERIRCVQDDLPKTANANTRKPPLDACKGLRQWRKLLETEKASPADEQWKTITEELNQACTDQDRLFLADRLRSQNRFGEALTEYEAARGSKVLDFANRARNGANATRQNKNLFVLPPALVLQLEKEGRFEEAYDLESKVAGPDDPHRRNLATLVGLRKSVPQLVSRNEVATAVTAYTNFLRANAQIDAVRDAYLIDAAEKEIPRLQLLSRAEAEKEVRSLLAVGDEQSRHGQFAAASSTFDKALQKRAEISPDLVREANEKASKAREQAAKEPSVYGTWLIFLAALHSVALMLFRGLLYSLLLIPVIVVALIMKRRTKDDVLLTMEDASTGTEQSHKVLTELMRSEMAVPGPSQKYQIDTPAGADGGSLGQLAIRVALRDMSMAFQGDPIKFGGFSINPIQLFSQFRVFFRPRYRYELQGSVSTKGPDKVCVVQLARTTVKNFEQTGAWQSTASGEAAVNIVLRDTAAKIMVDIDKTTKAITANWRSLARMRQGISLLQIAVDSPAQKAALDASALDAFQEAVSEDPSNWLARFNLASALRRLGFDALAAEHFAELERQHKLPAEQLPVVKYNHAASLQTADDDSRCDDALKLLTDVLATPNIEPVLLHLAQSGFAAAQATRMRRRKLRFRGDINAIAAKSLRDDARKLIVPTEQHLKAAEADAAAAVGVNGSQYTAVLAVFMNAIGQLQALIQRHHAARDSFGRAITLLPGFIEPRLNLAELYIERKRALDAGWATRAEKILLHVQQVDPKDKRALVLLGRLYDHAIFGRTAEATSLLTKALPNPEACLRLATILFRDGSAEAALAPLLSLLEQDTRSQSGQLLLARCVLALPDNHRCKCLLLRKSSSALTNIAKRPDGGKKKKEAAELSPEIDAAIARCK